MTEDDDNDITGATFKDILDLIKTNDKFYKITVCFILVVIVIALIIASHNIGYGKGYNYVLGFKDDYIDKYCSCYNSSMNKILTPIGNWDTKAWASFEDQSS